MEDKDSKISQEHNLEEVTSALIESEGTKSDAPENDEKEQDNKNSTSGPKERPKDFKDYLINKKPRKLAEGSADLYINQYLPRLKGVIESCKNKNDYTDFTDEDLRVLTDKDVKSALSAYYEYRKEYGYGASDKAPSKEPLQQIFYGAPGTGKSHEVNEKTRNQKVVRTTFHPDSDYSTFVGAYKPTMNEGGKIVYKFVSQAFLKAYMLAWKKFAEKGEDSEKEYLVIEEINRGNCAQIFGDLFQLLDRRGNGFSTYPIDADSDLQKEIEKAFRNGGEYALAEGFAIKEDAIDGYTSNYPNSNLAEDIKSGRVLLLPPNLYIWATMNTSDQSLFPIDSAFKRRWDWKYVPITNAGEDWKIKADGQTYDWWNFLEKINEKIENVTKSEDKQLGYFFCKPDNGTEISAETFVNKVIFYLWNDVFKDFNYNASSPFKNNEGAFSFKKFYKKEGKGGEVEVSTVAKFLENLGLESEEEKNKQLNKSSESPALDNNNSDADSLEDNEAKAQIDNDGESGGKLQD